MATPSDKTAAKPADKAHAANGHRNGSGYTSREISVENQEWLDSLDYVLHHGGPERVQTLLKMLSDYASRNGVDPYEEVSTPYVNTIAPWDQPAYPGDLELEQRICNAIRWNAMAMVVKGNKKDDGIGGHIATYASSAWLYEVGYNHFFKAPNDDQRGDLIFYQGHGSPGIYGRSFLEHRFDEQMLDNFRHELADGGGLSSYPHAYLMPDYWQFPTVSMGLGGLFAIYQARFNKYLHNRGLADTSDNYIWSFHGDGEMDEPETQGALSVAAREGLDNLTMIVNCNLQRLDGPVRGNGKIVQELESIFRGCGWKVFKVLWNSGWDELLADDVDGLLAQRLNDIKDGDWQRLTGASPDELRKHIFEANDQLKERYSDLTDEQIKGLDRGGHDPVKVYAAYKAAREWQGQPTVVLAQTVKGYGMGSGGEGAMSTHQQKKLDPDGVRAFAERFEIELDDKDVDSLDYYRYEKDSPEHSYMMERREKLGGTLPQRDVRTEPIAVAKDDWVNEFKEGTGDREVSTTMAFVRMLGKLLKDKNIGKLIVPIVPDESRTFGMEGLFRQIGIYSPHGQQYEPIDASSLMYYRESQDGQLLQEGITEVGSMASFLAAGTSYATHNVPTIPFYTFYSMFGLQRTMDLAWAAGDAMCRGFLMGGTAGRTTLNGEGLQHEDGQSHILAFGIPNLMAYDPAFAFEVALIIQDGLKRMYEDQENIFYYITIMNENYPQPKMPEGAEEGVLKGMYKFKPASKKRAKHHAQLFGSGTILREVLRAQEILEDEHNVAADVWSVTSYKELHRDAHEIERWNRRHPEEKPRTSYIHEQLSDTKGVFVAASDYVRAVPDTCGEFFPRRLHTLGTDGYGRSDSRHVLRRFFEVDAENIVLATLSALAQEDGYPAKKVAEARDKMGLDPDKPEPSLS